MVDYPLPPGMAERAAAFTGSPAPARRAATVALLRPADDGFRVYLMRRLAAMVFGGVYAFPGGSVDPADDLPDLRPDWPTRLGLPAQAARAVVAAAVREMFEETGVLFAEPAGPSAGAGPSTAAAELEGDRLALVERRTTLVEVLSRRRLRARDDLLVPWSRWVTPAFEPRRFDTWFFVAAVPAGCEPRDVSGEADRTGWLDPRAPGDVPMLPPTALTLRELAACRSIDAVLAADRDAGRPVQPQVVRGPDGRPALRLVSRSDP